MNPNTNKLEIAITKDSEDYIRIIPKLKDGKQLELVFTFLCQDFIIRDYTIEKQQLFSYFINIEFWKKQENQADQVEKAIQETIAYTEQIDIPGAQAEAYSIYGSFLIQKCNPREAISWFSKAAAIAEDTHNSNLLALTKYYTGICLYKLGHHAMANSYLREATEIAFQEKNQVIAQHSELMRAVVLMDQGKTDQSHEILRQWEHHFALNLC